MTRHMYASSSANNLNGLQHEEDLCQRRALTVARRSQVRQEARVGIVLMIERLQEAVLRLSQEVATGHLRLKALPQYQNIDEVTHCLQRTGIGCDRTRESQWPCLPDSCSGTSRPEAQPDRRHTASCLQPGRRS